MKASRRVAVTRWAIRADSSCRGHAIFLLSRGERLRCVCGVVAGKGPGTSTRGVLQVCVDLGARGKGQIGTHLRAEFCSCFCPFKSVLSMRSKIDTRRRNTHVQKRRFSNPNLAGRYPKLTHIVHFLERRGSVLIKNLHT